MLSAIIVYLNIYKKQQTGYKKRVKVKKCKTLFLFVQSIYIKLMLIKEIFHLYQKTEVL